MELHFDKGTLMLLTPERIVPPIPKLLRWDARTQVHRAPPFRYSELRSELEKRNAPFVDRVKGGPPCPDLKSKTLNLRHYQEAALACWKLSGFRGTVVLPTGSGKTLLAIGAIIRRQVPTLVLVPTRILLEQWIKNLTETLQVPIGILGDSQREIHSITVSTFESAYRYMGILGNRFQLLVIDEVHHFGNGARDEALEMSIAPFRIGLTATPPKDEKILSNLHSLVGPICYELSVHDLSGSYLSPFQSISIEVDLTLEERERYENEIQKFRVFYRKVCVLVQPLDWMVFLQVASQTEEGRIAVGAWRQAKRVIHYTRAKKEVLKSLLTNNSNRKILIFTADNDTAYAIARQFLIMPMTKDIKKNERQTVLDKFSRGELNALVSCRVLNEGLDVPDADMAIIVGSAGGEREHIQRIGRCLRPAPGKKAVIYDLISRATMEVKQLQRRRQSLGSPIPA